MAGPGYTVVQVDVVKGRQWLGRAWDPNEKTYRSKRHDTKGQALRWAKNESQRLAQGLSQAGRSMVDALLEDYIKDRRRKGGVEGYVGEVERVIKSAVAAGVTDLRHPRVVDHATAWLESAKSVHPRRKDRELAPKTKNRYLETLRTFANFAVRRKAILENPFRAIDPVKVPEKIKPTFKIDELRRLADPARADHEFYLAFQILIYTGCRLGEGIHLRWEWIDWTENRVSVKMDPGYALKGQRERVLPLQPELATKLKAAKAKLEEGDGKAEGYILPATLRDCSNKQLGNRFSGYLATCKVPDSPRRTPHSTRHTWISMMLATGENQLLVMSYAGHSQVDTTAGYSKTQDYYRAVVKDWPRGILLLQQESK